MTPTQSNNLKIGIGVAAAVVVGYFLFFNKDSGGTSQDPTGNNGGGVMPTPVFDANRVRLKLFDAMNRVGTDEDAIITTLRTVTPQQFDQVFVKFGKERYNDWLGYKTSFDTERDLAYWLKAELSSDEYLNLQRKYPNRL